MMTDEDIIRIHGKNGERWINLRDKIEWHCKGRHGVIRRVPKAEAYQVRDVLEYYFGAKCATWRKTPGEPSYMDVEFVHMTKVSPPPKRPWQWCGETLLFKDWMDRELLRAKQMQNFQVGDEVWFTHKGVTYEGVVSGGRTRVTVIVTTPKPGKWYVPPADLIKKSDISLSDYRGNDYGEDE